MASPEPIAKVIQETLDSRRKSLGRKDNNPYTPKSESSKDKYFKEMLRTPYLYMLSTTDIQETRRNSAKIKAAMEKREAALSADEKTHLIQKEDLEGNEDRSYLNEGWVTYTYDEDDKETVTVKGPILLSNTELSEEVGKTIKFGYGAYKPRGKKNRPYRPNAGVKGLTSEYISSAQQAFQRKVTVTWTCFTLEDLDVLQERFMTMGRKVYVEWGWAKDGLMPTPIFLEERTDGTYKVKEDVVKDKKIYNDEGNLTDIQSAAKLLKKEVLKAGEGEFDALIGYIEGFEFSQREDGGFDCTTNLTINGGNVFKSKPDPKKDPVPGEKIKPDMVSSKGGFIDAISRLPRILNHYLETSKTYPQKEKTIYEDYTTAESFESTTEEKNWWGKTFTGGHWDEDNAKRRTTSVQGLSTKTSQYRYNQNAIVKVDKTKFWEDFTKSGAFAGDEEGIDKQLKNIQRKGGFGKMRGDPRIEVYPHTSWVRYGWFEDNILNRFFSIVEEEGNFRDQIRSVKKYSEEEEKELEMRKAYYRERRTEKERKELIAAVSLNTFPVGIVAAASAKKLYGEQVWTHKTLSKIVADKKSSICTNHTAFKTPNINNFIFPGRFDLKGKGYNTRGLFGDDYLKKNPHQAGLKDEKYHTGQIEFEKGEEHATAKAYQDYLSSEENRTESDNPEDIKELQELLRQFRISGEDLDMNETAIVPYLELKLLESVVKEIAGPVDENTGEPIPPSRPFTTSKGDGFIRNIFINVDKLTKIFETPADSLGANFNLLRQTLIQETGGMIDIKAKQLDDGNIILEDTKNTKEDDSVLADLQSKTSPDGIYEFPVHTHDSFVDSQDISSDMGSKMQQIMMSKQFASQGIKDENGNLIAQAIFDGVLEKEKLVEGSTDNTKEVKPITRPATPYDLQFSESDEGWETYGQLDGDEDLPMDKGQGQTHSPPKTDEEKYSSTTNYEGNPDADAEQMGVIFEGIDTDYTIDGKLKQNQLKQMMTDLQVPPADVTEKKNEEGETEQWKIVPTTEETWGLLFITNTITMNGIAGIKPGDLWTTSYLPKKFRNNAHFWTTNVSQTIDSSGWKTSITGRVNMNLKKIGVVKDDGVVKDE